MLVTIAAGLFIALHFVKGRAAKYADLGKASILIGFIFYGAISGFMNFLNTHDLNSLGFSIILAFISLGCFMAAFGFIKIRNHL